MFHPAALVVGGLLAVAPLPDSAPATLWDAWPGRRVVPTLAPCLRAEELSQRLRALAARHPGRLTLEQAGRSVEGRPIQLLTLGRGPRRVLLWSQMHGDEPSATPALLDVAETLLAGGTPALDAVLERFTLAIVPMLNPDGAERYARRNAQGIDVNRDALALATPEGRLLKALRERFQPELGFNLHDQDRRTTVADTGVLSSISLLAVSADAQGTLGPGRARAKRVCSALVRVLSPFVPGGIARYDEDWNPRAFGDNLTAWGTPVVLIESGGLPPGRQPGDLTRLNYVALLSVLAGLAQDDLAGEDPVVYEALKRNQERLWVDVLLSGARVLQPGASEPYPADVAFDVLDDDPALAGCGVPGAPSRIRELGDGRLLTAARRVDATGRLVAPGFTASVRGLAARAWLDAGSLARIARAGVARVLWHVAPVERAEAMALAARLAGPGLPVVEPVEAARASCLLEIVARPAAAASASLAAQLDALAGRRWRERAGTRLLPGLIAELTAASAGGVPPPLLAPDARASLVVLRPLTAAALDADRLELEAVFVDGRAPAEGR